MWLGDRVSYPLTDRDGALSVQEDRIDRQGCKVASDLAMVVQRLFTELEHIGEHRDVSFSLEGGEGLEPCLHGRR